MSESLIRPDLSSNDSTKKKEVRQRNQQLIAEAIAKLLNQIAVIDKEIFIPLNGLEFNSRPRRDGRQSYELGAKYQEATFMEKRTKQLVLRIVKQSEQAKSIAQSSIDFVTEPHLRTVAARLGNLVLAGEVVDITLSVNVFDEEYEGNGFGQALVNQSDVGIKAGLKFFQLEHKKVIFAYILDMSAGRGNAVRPNQQENYRHKWSSASAIEAGYTADKIEEYLGQSYLLIQGKDNFFIKVYKDES